MDRERTERPMEPGLVQSVDRAAHILELLSEQPAMGVSEVSRELGVHRSTAFRLLATLEARNLVEQVDVRGDYRLGLGVLRMAGALTARSDLTRDAQACCEEMAGRLNETMNVSIFDADAAVTITQASGDQMIGVARQYVGQRVPLHATSTGKLLLAHAGLSEQQRVLTAPLERFTASTIVEPAQLAAELDRVRERGWATAVAEWEEGTNAVAVPVRGAGGAVIAALSVTAPSYRLPESGFEDVVAALREGADDLGARSGYLRPESAAH